MSLLARTSVALGAALALAGPAAAVTFLDGSFEGGALAAASSARAAGAVVLPAGGGHRAAGSNMAPASVMSKQRLAGLRRQPAASIWAALGTGGIHAAHSPASSPASTYRLTFDVSANPFDPAYRPLDKRVLVSATGMAPELFVYQLTDANTPDQHALPALRL